MKCKLCGEWNDDCACAELIVMAVLDLEKYPYGSILHRDKVRALVVKARYYIEANK